MGETTALPVQAETGRKTFHYYRRTGETAWKPWFCLGLSFQLLGGPTSRIGGISTETRPQQCPHQVSRESSIIDLGQGSKATVQVVLLERSQRELQHDVRADLKTLQPRFCLQPSPSKTKALELESLFTRTAAEHSVHEGFHIL